MKAKVMIFVFLLSLVFIVGACSLLDFVAPCYLPPLNSEIILTDGSYAGTRGMVTSIQRVGDADPIFTMRLSNGASLSVESCTGWIIAGDEVTEEAG